jgi:uncharacterized protein YidB (DUF937 family)
MGLLDEIIGTLPQQQTAAGGGLPNAIAGLLTNRQTGGMNGLMERFASAGLGHVFQSWVDPGPNQPISSEGIHRALGGNEVQAIAAQSGMSTSQLLPLLAQFLPTIVDKLTPHGQLPQGDLAEEEGAVRA